MLIGPFFGEAARRLTYPTKLAVTIHDFMYGPID
jgi:hypothetical protein